MRASDPAPVTALLLPPRVLAEIARHARDVYPEECCGYLVGPTALQNERRFVRHSERATNAADDDRAVRFQIAAADVRTAERRSLGTGEDLLGFYHSHPDQPARPSQADLVHAWPWYTYLIVSVGADHDPPPFAYEVNGRTHGLRQIAVELLDAPGGKGL